MANGRLLITGEDWWDARMYRLVIASDGRLAGASRTAPHRKSEWEGFRDEYDGNSMTIMAEEALAAQAEGETV